MLKKIIIVILILALIMPSTVTAFASSTSSNEPYAAEETFPCDDSVYYEVIFFVVLIYLPFGISVMGIENSGVSDNPFRWGSMYWDAHTQTYMTRHRHFSPHLGRWLSADPHWTIHNGNIIFGDSPTMRNDRYVPSVHAILQSGNLYLFTMNNPIMFADPTGLFAVPIWTVSLKCPKKGTCKLTGQDGVGGAGGNMARLTRPAPSPAPVVPPKPGVTPPATVTAPKPGSIAAKNATAPVAPKTPANQGVRTASTTLHNRNGIRIDVENPNPGARPGQIHVHSGTSKYIFDTHTGSFRTTSGQLAPKNIQSLLNDPTIMRAIEKGLTYLGY